MSKKTNAKTNAKTNDNKVNATKDKTIDKSVNKENKANANAKRIFESVKTHYANNVDFTIDNVAKTRKDKENDCMYNNDYTRINFIANANKTHAYFYIRIKDNSIYLVVNESIYNATKESVKTLVCRDNYIKYNKQSKTKDKIKIVKYYVKENNLFKACDIVIKAYANANA